MSAASWDKYLAQTLKSLPEEWRGTTFNNSNLLGRSGFVEKIYKLFAQKDVDGTPISTDDLIKLGNAEDYLRVATNLSTINETVLAADSQLPASQVISFASTNMGIVSVALTIAQNRRIQVFQGSAASPFSTSHLELLSKLDINISCHAGNPTDIDDAAIVLADESVENRENVDGVLSPNVLTILKTDRLDMDKVFVIRKRMSTPITTPMVEAMLQKRAGVEVTANTAVASADDITIFYNHLQTLAGTAPNNDAQPVITSAGLPAVNAFYTTLIANGGADIVMSSTAYGGCSQLTDILSGRLQNFNKYTFDIQGIKTDIGQRIKDRLDQLASDPSKLNPTTVLFVEIPTNPDMKVPDIEFVAAALTDYKSKTGKSVILLVDSTFAPNAGVMTKAKEVAPDLNAMVFMSLSKSVSRGRTTGGAIIANHTEESITLVKQIADTAAAYDTTVKPDQMHIMVNNHAGVEERVKAAYVIARDAGAALCEAVKEHTGEEMPLAFVSPESAARGFTSSTYSFNLPSPSNATAAINAGLAQRFVNLLCAHGEFKPCVSFGQDNTLSYATVPATSTQGAIKEEDKAKQAVGGVQLTRLSFPPTCDSKKVQQILTDAVKDIYTTSA